MFPSALTGSLWPAPQTEFIMTDFNLATADKHQLKFYAKSLRLDLSLSMSETTMREKIEKHIIENDMNINIADLLNVSRDDVAHTLVDLDGPAAGEATLQRIRSINGILSVRVLPIID